MRLPVVGAAEARRSGGARLVGGVEWAEMGMMRVALGLESFGGRAPRQYFSDPNGFQSRALPVACPGAPKTKVLLGASSHWPLQGLRDLPRLHWVLFLRGL